jgi:hypothetical protein
MNDRDHLEAVCVEPVCVEPHELSIGDLDEVSGGIAYGPSLTPSIPIPPPLLALLGGAFGP